MSDADREPPEPGPVRRLTDPGFSKSLDRGLAILACFTPRRPVLGVVDIADSLGMSRPSAHRYMKRWWSLAISYRTPPASISWGCG
jgi:IclR helix-turn-helix domain